MSATHSLAVLAAPAAQLAVALLAIRPLGKRTSRGKRSPGRRPQGVLAGALGAALIGLPLAAMAGFQVAAAGPVTSPVLGFGDIGLSVRLDAVSAVMFALVAFVGAIVVRFAATYLDGEPRQGVFMGWLCATLAAVMLLVLAGNLPTLAAAWIGCSLALHRLLLFYPDRPKARAAARKKFLVARLGDAALVGACVILWTTYGSPDIATILAEARAEGPASGIGWAAWMLALAAILKSAQFPTHGWLIDVVETPTPVSALLHAGIVNAGGFLLVRFADVMLLAPGVLAMLVMVGGFTALFGGLVMLTQPMVKNSLAWSTIAQMGFMIMQCGLALFPLALLHIVAHSLYKAHAFLSSATAVEVIAAIPRPGPVAVPNGKAVLRAFAIALCVFGVIHAGFGLVFGFDAKSPQAVVLGAILIFGVAYLVAQGLADAAPPALTRRTALYALAASTGYFALQRATESLTQGALPPVPDPGPLQWALLLLAIFSFGVMAVAQAMFPNWAHHPAAAGLRVHLANGFYANAVFDRLAGARAVRRPRQSAKGV